MSPFFPLGASDGADSSQSSTPEHPTVRPHAPEKERTQEKPPIFISGVFHQDEASLQLDVLRSTLAELQRRLDPDRGIGKTTYAQGMSNLEHMHSALVLAKRGLAVLERCEGL